MMTTQVLDITANRSGVDTYESYSIAYFIYDGSLVMPVINLQLFKGVIGNSTNIRIDYAYIILKGVSEIQWAGQLDGKDFAGRLPIQPQPADTLVDEFMFHHEHDGYQLKVYYQKMHLHIPSQAKSTERYEGWVPWDTPNFKKNLSDLDITKFQNLEWLPQRLLDKLSRQGQQQTLKFAPGTEAESNAILESWRNDDRSNIKPFENRDIKVIAAFLGVKFLPRVIALAYNNLNPKLILSDDGIEYRAFVLTGRIKYNEIEKVDILLATGTTNVILARNNSVITVSANTNNRRELYRCLQYLEAKGCQLTERARVFCLDHHED